MNISHVSADPDYEFRLGAAIAEAYAHNEMIESAIAEVVAQFPEIGGWAVRFAWRAIDMHVLRSTHNDHKES